MRLPPLLVVAVSWLAGAGACRIEPPPGSGTPPVAAIDACRALADQGARCYALGLDHFAESDSGRIFGLRAFSAACELGHGDACYSAAVLLQGARELSFFDRGCAVGHRLSCDRAAERRGTRKHTCRVGPRGQVAMRPSDGGPSLAALPSPQLVHAPRPAYPEVARAARLEATVTACLFYDETGRVSDVQIAREGPAFAEHVRSVVATWRIAPYVLNGKPSSIIVRQPFTFAVP